MEGAVGAALALVHGGSALLYLTGPVPTATRTLLARRATTAGERNALPGRFDFLSRSRSGPSST